ncbi:Ribonuclease P protein component [uncultured Desulfobacterium sp.]|uniref:Ribonuclease P protein component n=1 Tax=uncultured Desulfobacterium sp. TaxID=201089 RepID=A0A445N376_9BACT|nr:Ribonuclease P protein component [uncultured Desulfobacterium sp.]
MGSFSFPQSERILKRADFVNLNRSGKRLYTKHFTLILKPNGQGVTRLGVTVGKKFGNAVRRNRLKRLVREYYRLNKACLPHGYDIVIIAKNNDASYLDLWKINEEIQNVFNNKLCE